MTDLLTQAVEHLSARMTGPFDGSAMFRIADLGAILIDEQGVRAADGSADVTLAADAETFQAILSGDLHPTAAFMSGRLTVEGDMGTALRLGSVLG